MKRTILSLVIFIAVSAFSLIVPSDTPENYGCDCTGSPVTITVCRPKNCPGSAQDLSVVLVDETCNTSTGPCTITASNNCCTVTTTACSNHTFRVDYGPALGTVCSTASFTPSGNPYTVNINCTCP